MEIIENQNYARKNIIFDNIHFKNCNFAKDIIGITLMITNSIFEECNLVNCAIDESNTIENCNISQINNLDEV
jgi:hypothetical protein